MIDGRKWGDGYAYRGDRVANAKGAEEVLIEKERVNLCVGLITKCGPGWSDYNWHKDDRPPVGTVHGPTGWVRLPSGWGFSPDAEKCVWSGASGTVWVPGAKSKTAPDATTIEEAATIYRHHTEGYGIDERPPLGTVCPVSGLVYRDGYWEPQGRHTAEAWWVDPRVADIVPGIVSDAEDNRITTATNTAEAGRILDEHRAKQAPTFDASTIADIPADEGAAQLQRMATRTVERVDAGSAANAMKALDAMINNQCSGDLSSLDVFGKAAGVIEAFIEAHTPKPAVWRTEPPTEADVGHVWFSEEGGTVVAGLVSLDGDDVVLMAEPKPDQTIEVWSRGGRWCKGYAWTPANTTPPAWVDPAAEKLRGVLSRALGIEATDEQLAAVMAEGVMG